MDKEIVDKVSKVIVGDYFKGRSLKDSVESGRKLMEALEHEQSREKEKDKRVV